MGGRGDSAWSKGIVELINTRETRGECRRFQNRLHVTRSSIERLGLETELHGHTGCVNCLEWNSDGSILASASDDLHVILWDPFRYKALHNITTDHTGNIFSVKFVSPDVIATCAADSTVRTRSIHGEALGQCACHCGRVKRLATAADNPNLMWSAAEDGLIIQHDMRVKHTCNLSANILVNLMNHMGRYAEAKCVANNPRRPYQLAVGANDFYVRLYDTRMITLAKLQGAVPGTPRQTWARHNIRCARAGHGDPDNNVPRDAVHYFAPGHLSIELNDAQFPKKATTYVAFSNDGNELLVNLGSEQVYLFDINLGRRPLLVESFIIEHNHTRGRRQPPPPPPPPPLSPQALKLKELANSLVMGGQWAAAVSQYGAALAHAPRSALLAANRAAALLKRGWSGDTYAAIKDCYTAIKLDPTHVKSHFRLAKALMDMKRAREAHECLLYFKDKFPRHANSHAVFLLQKEINDALEGVETQPDEGTATVPEDEESAAALSALERQCRSTATDYELRFVGHCNTTTDIKEANFLGPDAAFVAAGSDDGSIFIWERSSGNIVRCLRGDDSIVNCLQMHPSTFMLATSGIETVVRLWSPRSEEALEARLVGDWGAAAAANQERMRSDPFESMLFSISFDGAHDLPASACRTT